MVISEDTHLTDKKAVRLFCRHIILHKYKYNSEKQFAENRRLSEAQQAILVRLVAEANSLLSKDNDTFEHQLKIAVNTYNQQIKAQQRRHQVNRMLLHIQITGDAIY